ncbi:hypothetical protein C8R43DRAFT_955991 [Mycena crocata]|nr:hypothetical protein C8R43DRAFT_955991 [Mycena crocata]
MRRIDVISIALEGLACRCLHSREDQREERREEPFLASGRPLATTRVEYYYTVGEKRREGKGREGKGKEGKRRPPPIISYLVLAMARRKDMEGHLDEGQRESDPWAAESPSVKNAKLSRAPTHITRSFKRRARIIVRDPTQAARNNENAGSYFPGSSPGYTALHTRGTRGTRGEPAGYELGGRGRDCVEACRVLEASEQRDAEGRKEGRNSSEAFSKEERVLSLRKRGEEKVLKREARLIEVLDLRGKSCH